MYSKGKECVGRGGYSLNDVCSYDYDVTCNCMWLTGELCTFSAGFKKT